MAQSQGAEFEGVSAAMRQAIESMRAEIDRFNKEDVQLLQEQVARVQETFSGSTSRGFNASRQ